MAAMRLSLEGALVPASPDWLWLLGVNHGVFQSSQVCLKDTPAVLETIKALLVSTASASFSLSSPFYCSSLPRPLLRQGSSTAVQLTWYLRMALNF